MRLRVKLRRALQRMRATVVSAWRFATIGPLSIGVDIDHTHGIVSIVAMRKDRSTGRLYVEFMETRSLQCPHCKLGLHAPYKGCAGATYEDEA